MIDRKLGERWLWFRYAFEEDKPVATKPEMHELIELYLERHDEEINELEKDRNRGHKKPKNARQQLLESIKAREASEYTSGMELPDMTNGKTLKLLREWDGDKNSMTRMTTIRLQKPDDTTKAAPVDNSNKKDKDMMEM